MSVSARASYVVPLPDGRALELGPRTLLMGILNVTPDSFADGGERFDPDIAVQDGIRMVAQGADILDVGGESTRPGAAPVDAAEERRRVEPVLEGLRGCVDVPLSIDTYKADVAARALDLGATMVNDISALTYDPALAGVIARRRAAVVLMHTRGRSSDMYRFAEYRDVGAEVAAELAALLRRAESSGIPPAHIILDPGFGFAKRAHHSFDLLAHLSALAALGRPILAGPSRKSFLTAGLGDVPPDQRVWGTAAAVAAAVLFGAHIVRVHDVAQMVQVVRVADLIRRHDAVTLPPF